jgi:hypothetical protein
MYWARLLGKKLGRINATDPGPVLNGSAFRAADTNEALGLGVSAIHFLTGIPLTSEK